MNASDHLRQGRGGGKNFIRKDRDRGGRGGSSISGRCYLYISWGKKDPARVCRSKKKMAATRRGKGYDGITLLETAPSAVTRKDKKHREEEFTRKAPPKLDKKKKGGVTEKADTRKEENSGFTKEIRIGSVATVPGKDSSTTRGQSSAGEKGTIIFIGKAVTNPRKEHRVTVELPEKHTTKSVMLRVKRNRAGSSSQQAYKRKEKKPSS